MNEFGFINRRADITWPASSIADGIVDRERGEKCDANGPGAGSHHFRVTISRRPHTFWFLSYIIILIIIINIDMRVGLLDSAFNWLCWSPGGERELDNEDDGPQLKERLIALCYRSPFLVS